MGRHKLLLPWKSSTLVEHVLGAWQASCVDHVVVVVRAEDVQLADICRCATPDVVLADPPPADMKASVQLALDYIQHRFSPGGSDAWLLAPADVPWLSARLIDQLLAAYDPSCPAIVVPMAAGRRGHPIVLPWDVAGQVAGLGPDEGINRLLDRWSVRQLEIGDPAILTDLDTPSDYRRLQNRQKPT